jgi:hypothetical protein
VKEVITILMENIDISENKQGVYILGIKQGNKVK